MRITVERLRRAGLDPSALAVVESLLAQPRPSAPAPVPCMACGVPRSLPLDTLCGRCSTLKAEDPRRFWTMVREKNRLSLFGVTGPIPVRPGSMGDDPDGGVR